MLGARDEGVDGVGQDVHTRATLACHMTTCKKLHVEGGNAVLALL